MPVVTGEMRRGESGDPYAGAERAEGPVSLVRCV
jgi:hypothetical protein